MICLLVAKPLTYSNGYWLRFIKLHTLGHPFFVPQVKVEQDVHLQIIQAMQE